MNLREEEIRKRGYSSKLEAKTLEALPDLDFEDLQAILDLIDYALEDDSKCDGCERIHPDEAYSYVCENPPERY